MRTCDFILLQQLAVVGLKHRDRATLIYVETSANSLPNDEEVHKCVMPADGSSNNLRQKSESLDHSSCLFFQNRKITISH